jgi:Uma2 family endonuclease
MKVSTAAKMTIAELDRLPDDGNRYELIDGELFVAPSSFEIHQRIQMRLSRKLDEFADQQDLGRVYTAPFDVYLPLPQATGDTRVQPDILFVSKARSHIVHRWVRGAPDLVVEILSDATARADQYEKRDAYRASGVQEYWVVDPNRQNVTVHRFATGEAPHVLSGDETLTTPLLPGFELSVSFIFC